MGKLIYATPMSLDGYIAVEGGDLEWSAPDEEVHAFINDVIRPVGTHLYGRKMYQTMAVWETPEVMPGLTPAAADFARIWQAADKVVFSKTLDTVSTGKTRLERQFNPQAIRGLKDQLLHDITVSGPTLAAQAIREGIVDEYHLFVSPVILGGGMAVIPGNLRLRLELLDERRFDSGTIYLRYRARTSRAT